MNVPRYPSGKPPQQAGKFSKTAVPIPTMPPGRMMPMGMAPPSMGASMGGRPNVPPMISMGIPLMNPLNQMSMAGSMMRPPPMGSNPFNSPGNPPPMGNPFGNPMMNAAMSMPRPAPISTNNKG